MRQASTPERTSEINTALIGQQLSSEVALYYKDQGTWILLEDFDEEQGVSWDLSGQRLDYSANILVPAASQIAFSVKNYDGRYSPGSGEIEDNVLDAGTPIKLLAGYELSDYEPIQSQVLPLIPNGSGFCFGTKIVNGLLVADPINSMGQVDKYFTDLFGLYGDAATYGDSHYGPGGYFVSTFAFNRRGVNEILNIALTANTANLKVYYRIFNSKGEIATKTNSYDWISAGNTVAGTKTISVNGVAKYIQIAIMWDGGSWATMQAWSPTALSLTYKSKIEWLYKSIYYLDTPEYNDPPAPEIPTVTCNGRDLFKRAQESQPNLPDMSGGMHLDVLLKYLCDQIQIPYSATSIADLTAFPQRYLATGLAQATTGDKIFEWIMQCAYRHGMTKYFMFCKYDETMDENILFVQPKPTAVTTLVNFTYHLVENIGAKRKNYDKLVSRMTFLTKRESQQGEQSLWSAAYTQVDNGLIVMSWSGDAEYKRIRVTGTGDYHLELGPTNPVQPTSISLVLSGTAFSITISIYGIKWTAPPAYQGESINIANYLAGTGKMVDIENPLLASNAEAGDVAWGFIEDYGNPAYEVGDLGYPYLNLIVDQNDQALIWSKINFIDTVYFVTNIRHNWNRSSSPTQKTAYTLTDTGLNLADLGLMTWDSIKYWDRGWLWDMNMGTRAKSDPRDYNNLKPVRFT